MVRAILDWTLPYYLSPLLILSAVYITEYYHQPIIILWINFVFIPVLDMILPEDHTNPTEEEEKILVKQTRWMIPLLVAVASEWFATFWSLSYLLRNDTGIVEFLLLLLTIGLVNTGGILTSHELFHKRELVYKVIGTVNLLKCLSMHFYSEHLYGHHKYVATPEDPATAKLNQTVSEFNWNSMKSEFTCSWRREANKLKKKNLPVYSLSNKMIQFIVVEVSLLVLIFYFCGIKCCVFFMMQAFVANNFLESTNYIRHYGLLRKKLENGEYEPVTTKHSWNAPQLLQNFQTFKLQRHSDHHACAYKPYQILQSPENAPYLPCGYSVCLLACNFPSFWFGIINPMVEATNKDGKPSEEQMRQSTGALRRYMVYHTVVVSAIAYLELVINA